MEESFDYKEKYLKYKFKYLELQSQLGGSYLTSGIKQVYKVTTGKYAEEINEINHILNKTVYLLDGNIIESYGYNPNDLQGAQLLYTNTDLLLVSSEQTQDDNSDDEQKDDSEPVEDIDFQTFQVNKSQNLNKLPNVKKFLKAVKQRIKVYKNKALDQNQSNLIRSAYNSGIKFLERILEIHYMCKGATGFFKYTVKECFKNIYAEQQKNRLQINQYQGQYLQPQGQYPQPQGQYPQPQGQYPQPQGQYPQPQGQYQQPQGQYQQPQGQYPQNRGQYPQYKGGDLTQAEYKQKYYKYKAKYYNLVEFIEQNGGLSTVLSYGSAALAKVKSMGSSAVDTVKSMGSSAASGVKSLAFAATKSNAKADEIRLILKENPEFSSIVLGANEKDTKDLLAKMKKENNDSLEKMKQEIKVKNDKITKLEQKLFSCKKTSASITYDDERCFQAPGTPSAAPVTA
jgi:hypothetical protein